MHKNLKLKVVFFTTQIIFFLNCYNILSYAYTSMHPPDLLRNIPLILEY